MHKRTKALAIPPLVKMAVAKRDSIDGHPCCVLCGLPAPADNPTAFSCCHYIARSQGGVGVEENILTLCPTCHRKYDQSATRAALRPVLRRYLKEHYEHWREEDLTYRKEF
jgi:5-methylcytosine-specific restriction endonuclease McrA